MNDGWDISNSLNYILHQNEFDFTEEDKAMAKFLLDVIKINPKGNEEFQVHTKGMGIICNK